MSAPINPQDTPEEVVKYKIEQRDDGWYYIKTIEIKCDDKYDAMYLLREHSE